VIASKTQDDIHQIVERLPLCYADKLQLTINTLHDDKCQEKQPTWRAFKCYLRLENKI